MVEILEFFQPKGLPFLEKKPVSNSCKNNIDLKFHSPRKKGSLVMTVLMGPRWSGKTSLLFSYALSKACEGEDIYFICFKNKEKLIESPPFLPEWFVVLPDLNLKKELLKLIHFRYFKKLLTFLFDNL
jgi:predicted AAA+ superfamily ATPase